MSTVGKQRSSRASATTGPVHDKGRSRELALLALCHLESYPDHEHRDALALLWGSPPRGDGDRGAVFANLVADAGAQQRANTMVRALLERWVELDTIIEETSERWRMERMAQVDRNVLRLVAFELMERRNTPRPVILSEAVRLAQRYGSERSSGFVNGVAGSLARRLRPEGDG